MQLSEEERRRRYRLIYDILWESPRVHLKIQGLQKKQASTMFREALEKQTIMGPQLRKKSFENLKEYMYFVTCRDPELSYLEFREDPNIIYHAKTMGFCNLWVVAKEKFDIPGEIICEGYRSDYYVSYAPDRSWDAAMKIIDKKVNAFDPKNYEPQQFIEVHFGEPIPWSDTDQILFEYFKPNLRKPLSPLIKNQGIFSERIYRFLGRLPEVCTVFTDYYPETLLSYDPYLFMIETDYEDFIIDLFSQLPTTSSFFKVNDTLFAYTHIPQQYVRSKDLIGVQKRLYVPHLLIRLRKEGIIKSKDYDLVEYYWRKHI